MGWDFGGDTAAAARWLYAPPVSKAMLKGGYPTVCLDCYACGWWNTAANGQFRKVHALTCTDCAELTPAEPAELTAAEPAELTAAEARASLAAVAIPCIQYTSN